MKSISPILLAVMAGTTLAGCGGGGSSGFSPNPTPTPTSTPPVLTGKTAIRAGLTSGYQSFHAAINYPYAGIQLALPASSPFRTSKAATLRAAATGQFNADLQLYETQTTKANVVTINFYKDAALTQSAGNSVLTAPVGQTVGGDYKSYPVVLSITQNITAGTLPCQGSGTITFSGSSGANKLVGTLNLPKTGLKVTANLTLSNSGQVGGTVTIIGNGQTIALSNLSGPIDGDIAGKASISPDNITGTGVVNVLTGKFAITLDTSSGKATATANSDGSLGIVFPDGLAEKLTSPLSIVAGEDPGNPTPTATPKATATPKPTATSAPTPTPTPLPGNAVYNAPVALQTTATLVGLNDKNHFIASSSGIHYYSSPTDAGKILPGSAASTSFFVKKFNGNDATLVNDLSENAPSALFWASPTAARTELKTFSSGNFKTSPQDLNDAGRIVGYDQSHLGSGDHALYWSSPTAAPVALKARLDNDTVSAYKINSKGAILGISAESQLPIYWSSATAIPQDLQVLPTQSSIFYVEGINTAANIFVKGTNGVSSYYATPTSQPVLLPFLAGARNVNDSVYGAASMNDHNIIVGTSPQASQGVLNSAVRWLTTGGKVQVQDLNTLIPANSGWKLFSASFINNNGTIIGQGTLNGKSSAFYLTPR